MASANTYPDLACWVRVDGGVQACIMGKLSGPVIDNADFIQYLEDTKQIDPA